MPLPFRYDSVYTARSRAIVLPARGTLEGEMGLSSQTLYAHIADPLFAVLKTEFNDSPEVYHLFDEFLQHETYDRAYALQLLDRAKQTDAWHIRRLAALMLEHQLVQLPIDRSEEFALLFTRLNIKSHEANGAQVNDSVLKEGYSTTALGAFILEFRRRLERQNRILSL